MRPGWCTFALCACLAALAACSTRAGEGPAAPSEPGSAAQPAGQTMFQQRGLERRARVPVPVPEELQAVVDAQDREAADRELDAGRRPGELLAFFGVKRGQRVAELMAGGGYTAELLARAVGPEGKVYAVNSPFILRRFAEQPWSERLRKPVMANVVRLDRELDDPFPEEVTDLDAVFCVLVYHDFVWMNVDRARLNRAVLRALKP